ncbi:hypothetical protein N7539_008814 [Penicillium diatomitis]|uniref:Uncharacterized protein n=1 Tax=Penicillium diatomitis TaxID=2819901 RepID=A0A9W9WQK7_9EURO|nr:uncharacterized protein N7539_008814 [Penicillium diatomitis]KAJ5471871.1 hypothetical protein N7539_008814 [Penicillium diatomitis]
MMVASHDTSTRVCDNIEQHKKDTKTCAARTSRKAEKKRQNDEMEIKKLNEQLEKYHKENQELKIQLVKSQADHSQYKLRAAKAEEALERTQHILTQLMTKLPPSSHLTNNVDTKSGGTLSSASWLTITPRLNGHTQSWPCLSPVSPTSGKDWSGISPSAFELTWKKD